MAKPNFVWGFIGYTGTGKTTTAKILAKEWKRVNPRNNIIAFDPHEILSNAGLVDYYINLKDDNWAEIVIQKDDKGNYKFANSLIILDDYRSLLKSDKMPTGFLDLVMLRRKMNIDIIFIIHNPKLILERLSYFVTHYSIFYTESTASDFSDKIPKYTNCQRAAVLINKYVLKYGMGKYPHFPHVIVYNKSDVLELVNIDKNQLKKIYDEKFEFI